MTVLDRLVAKDLVVRERDGRAFRYAPRLSRAAMTAEVMREALEAPAPTATRPSSRSSARPAPRTSRRCAAPSPTSPDRAGTRAC